MEDIPYVLFCRNLTIVPHSTSCPVGGLKRIIFNVIMCKYGTVLQNIKSVCRLLKYISLMTVFWQFSDTA